MRGEQNFPTLMAKVVACSRKPVIRNTFMLITPSSPPPPPFFTGKSAVYAPDRSTQMRRSVLIFGRVRRFDAIFAPIILLPKIVASDHG